MKFQRVRKIKNPNRREMTVNILESKDFQDVIKMLDKALKIVEKRK